MISPRAHAIVQALDDQSWNGPGYLDVRKKLEIVQAFLDEHRAEVLCNEPLGYSIKHWEQP